MYKKLILVISLILLSLMGCAGCALCSSQGNSTDPMVVKFIRDTNIKQIRYKNWMWDCFVDKSAFIQVGDTLFVNKETWERVLQEKRETWFASLIAHEATHAARQMVIGFRWFIYYAISSEFRWNEEKIASIEGWRVYVKRGEKITDYDMKEWARSMSGPIYKYMTTYEEALAFARETVKRLLEDNDTTIFTNN